MTKRPLILALILSVAISAYPLDIASAKSGTKCSKAGAITTSAGKKYTCVKSGTKLLWSKGVTVKAAAKPPINPVFKPSEPTPKPSQSSIPADSFNGSECTKLNEEITNSRGMYKCLLRNDGQLFWSKNNPQAPGIEPTPRPTPTPTPTVNKSPDQITGQICTKENDRIRNSVNEFLCRKDSRGTLLWIENFRFANPYPMPALPLISYETNQYFAPKMPGAPISNCKIQENSDQGAKRGDLASGFPFMPRFVNYPKKVTMALVPIDFLDLPGDQDFRSRIKQDMEFMSDWFRDVSGGRMTIEWKVSNDWIRLPGNSKDYYVESSGKYPDTVNFWQKVMPIVDSKFDLSGVQTVNFLFPLNQKVAYESVQSFSFLTEMKEINSSKTKIYSFAAAGEVFEAPTANLWSYWAHEFGHELGLAHVGSSRGDVEPMNGIDLMGNQNGPYRDLSGWMRFIIGWLADDQVYCQSTSGVVSNDVSLVPLNESKDGIKLVVIPTGLESAIIIESRRPSKYACPIPNLPGGVLVSTYDARLGNQSYFLKAQYPSDRQPTIRCEVGVTIPDVFLHTGDSVQVGDYKISIISSGTFDQVRITKN